MRNKALFVLRFLTAFALLIVLGWSTNAQQHYARLLAACARIASPLVNGWWLEERAGGSGVELWFRHGVSELRLLLSLESLALGLLPLLALLSATPGLGLRRAAVAALIGGAAFFTLDLVVVLLYPLLVSSPNALTDITGTFLGLLTFVGAPIILWFVLTFDRLRQVWRLGPEGQRPVTSDQ
jgi:hypothetical protein